MEGKQGSPRSKIAAYMNTKSKPGIGPVLTRYILETDIPRDVLEILLADQPTGRSIMWMTDVAKTGMPRSYQQYVRVPLRTEKKT